MKFEEFRENAITKFKEYVAKNDKELIIQKVFKNNLIKEGLTIKEKNNNIAPTIYIEDLYKAYRLNNETISFNAFIENIINDIQTNSKEVQEIKEFFDKKNFSWDSMKDNIIFTLVNTKQNENSLKNMPHREFLDLSIIYRILIGNYGSIIIKNDLMSNLQLSEDELYNLAYKNTKNLLNISVKDMNDIMPMGIFSLEKSFYILNSKDYPFSSCGILYSEFLEDVSQKVNSDLYLIPSSVHEFLLISADSIPTSEISQFVPDVNRIQVHLEEQLSNQVYLYDKDTKEITIISKNKEELQEYDNYE